MLFPTQVYQNGVAAYIENPSLASDYAIFGGEAVSKKPSPVVNRLIHRGFQFERSIPNPIVEPVGKACLMPVLRDKGIRDCLTIIERTRDQRCRARDTSVRFRVYRDIVVSSVVGKIVKKSLRCPDSLDVPNEIVMIIDSLVNERFVHGDRPAARTPGLAPTLKIKVAPHRKNPFESISLHDFQRRRALETAIRCGNPAIRQVGVVREYDPQRLVNAQ